MVINFDAEALVLGRFKLGGINVQLTRNEMMVLTTIIGSGEAGATWKDIAWVIWGNFAQKRSTTVSVHLHTLRGKLENTGHAIEYRPQKQTYHFVEETNGSPDAA